MALSNSQYDALMRIYQRRQTENRHKQEARIAQVYWAIPQMEEYDREIAAVSVEQAKRLLSGDQAALERLRTKLAELREGKETLLAMGGFSKEFMAPVYTCPACKDTGYVDGKKCRCFRQAEIQILYGQSNLEHVLERENFDHLVYDYYDKELIVNEKQGLSQYDYMKQVVAGCRSYVEHFREKGGNLLFTGSAGTGKTFLTNCIAKALLDRAEAVLYLTAPDLFQIIVDHRFGRDNGNREKYDGLFSCDLLIIDDLGTELGNSLENSELFYCINDRKLREKSTIISTNLSINELRRTYSERIASRVMNDYRVIPLFGGDIRIKKKIGQSRA